MVINEQMFGACDKMKRLRPTNKVRRTLRGSSAGFTLIEVLVALALFGIIAITFAGGLSTASRATITADIRTNAESLARTQMEYVKNQPYEHSDPQSYEQDDVESTDQPGYFISVSAESLHDPDDGIQEIMVTVSHDDRVVITLASYKVNR